MSDPPWEYMNYRFPEVCNFSLTISAGIVKRLFCPLGQYFFVLGLTEAAFIMYLNNFFEHKIKV